MTTEEFVRGVLSAFRQPLSAQGDAYDLGLRFVFEHSDAVAPVATAFVQASLDTSTFLNDILAFLPLFEWPALIIIAVHALSIQPSNGAASDVIEKASLQIPRALHPHLAQLYTLTKRHSMIEYSADKASRDASLALVGDVMNECPDLLAYPQALLETRLPDIFDNVKDHDPASFALLLADVGFEETSNGYRQLYPTRPFHLYYGVNERAARERMAGGTMWRLIHPTWTTANPVAPSYRFGGRATVDCGVCGQRAHRLLTLDPVPNDIGVTDLGQLDLVTCLSCLGWARYALAYGHQANGQVDDLNYRGVYTPPRFPAEPFREFTLSPVDLGDRWRWQDGGISNGRENLNRIGGHPTWIQDAEYLTCPTCNRTLNFLLQLDSGCDGEGYLWGTGGTCYLFWCDDCKTSSMFWQCT